MKIYMAKDGLHIEARMQELITLRAAIDGALDQGKGSAMGLVGNVYVEVKNDDLSRNR